MKKFTLSLAAAVTAVSLIGLPVFAQSGAATVPPNPAPQAPQVQVPAAETLLILIRTSIIALNQANVTNNYAVLNALGSPSFQQNNSPEKLSQIFTTFRANRIDLSPVVVINPTLNNRAAIAEGKLKMTGFFPSAPMRTNFDLTFELVQGNWKLYGISVNLAPVPVAQPAPAQPAPKPVTPQR